MQDHNTSTSRRVWYESGHASLCLLGVKLRRMGLFKPLEAHVKIRQKVLKYTPVQKLEMFLVGVLAGAQAVSQTATTVRLDPALVSAFGLPGCADQSSIAQTLNAATEQDVVDLQAALGELFGSYSQAHRHDFTHEMLVLDIDLSPLPASSAAEGSERGYMGRCRSKTGRKLVRVRAAGTQEIVWETVIAGRRVESLPVLQEAIYAMESRLGMGEEDNDSRKKRGRTEIRLDSGWGSGPNITWLLERGYQVTGKFKSAGRVRKLVRGISTWQPTSSPGREVAEVPEPVAFVRPLAQYAVRTPSKEHKEGYYLLTKTALCTKLVHFHPEGWRAFLTSRVFDGTRENYCYSDTAIL